jgi:hypothetical protein
MRHAALILTDEFSTLLARLPPGLDLDRLARETKAIRRDRNVKRGADLLRLTLARGPGGLSLRQAASWSSRIGMAELSNPGLKYRLDQAAGFLDAVIVALLTARLGTPMPSWPGRSLALSHGTNAGVHGVFDLERGRFSHLAVTDAQNGQSHAEAAPGEIRIDTGIIPTAPALRRIQAADPKADYIVRLALDTDQLTTPNGDRFDPVEHLSPPRDAGTARDVDLLLAGTDAPTLRLVLLRPPPETDPGAGATPTQNDPANPADTAIMMLATSLPSVTYPAADIVAAYRLGCQIALAFKRLKSLIDMDQLRTTTECGSRSWLSAYLVFALIHDDLAPQTPNAAA